MLKWGVGVLALIALAGGLFAQVPQQLYYQFNEGVGTSIANTALPGGGSPAMTTNTGNTWTSPGHLGSSAMDFAASGQMATGYAANFTNNDSFTVEFWIRGASTSTLGYITGDNASGGLRVFTGGAAGTGGILWQAASGFSATGVTTGVFDGTWHHVAFVFDGTAKTLTLYVDGVQGAQSINQTSGAITGTDWYIGGHTATAATFLGSMDEFRFWNVARSQIEIQANMNVELSGTIPTLQPASGSSFVSPLTLNATLGVPISNADLVANDGNDPQISVVVTPVSAAPGVTAPSNNAAATVPYALSWSGTPTAVGTYTYDVTLADGTNNPTFTVTINVQDVGPTLVPAPGSAFQQTLTINGAPGYPLTNAVLRADDANTSLVSYTVTTINGHASITPPSSQTNVTVPTDLIWSGTPAVTGTFTYQVDVTDGANPATFVVTVNVAPAELLLGSLTGTTNTIPFNQTSVRFLTVFAANEITMPAGAVISEIRVAGSIVTPPQYNGLRIRLAHSNQTPNALVSTFDSNYNAPLQTVFGPADYTPTTLPIGASSQWYVYPLSNPFVYNGVDGIAVDWSYDSKIGTGNTIFTTVPTGEQVRGRVYSTSGNYLTPTGTVGTTLGNYGIHMLTYPADSAALTSVPESGIISAPHTNLVVMDMNGISVLAARALNSVTFSEVGSISDAAISQVRLVVDVNNDGVVDGGDTVLGTAALSGGQVTFSGSPLVTIPDTTANPTMRLLLAVDIPASQAPGTTMRFQVLNGASVVFGGGTDVTSYPLLGTFFIRPFSGTVTINQTSGDFTDIGAAFDALENAGVNGPVILEITDSATYVSTPAYSLGISSDVPLPVLAQVAGVSPTNTITLRAAPGQSPRIQGNAGGAVLMGTSATAAQTGRGGLVINQSYTTVEGLEVFGGPHFGIMTQGNNTAAIGLNHTDITIRRCKVYDVQDGPGIAHMGLNSGWATNYIVEHNFVYNCAQNLSATPFLQTLTNGAITVRNTPSANGAIVRHNTVVHTSTDANTGGIYVYNSSGAFPLNVCENNIVICTAATVPAIRLGGSGAGSATYAPTIADFNYWFAATHCNVSTLATFALWQGTGRDANGSNADPLLMNPAAPFDLRLHPNSPCINPVGQTSTATVDFFGTARPQGATTDIGAHEANWVAGLAIEGSQAGPASVTTSLPVDQWVGTFNAMSVLSIQTVNSVTLTHSGSVSNTVYSNLKLWVDANANGSFDVGDTQLGTTMAGLTGSTVTFSGSPLGAFTAQNQALVFFVTAQIAGGTPLGTAQFRIVAGTDISATPGPVVGTFPAVGKLINVENPPSTLTPAIGSGFNSSLVYNALQGVALANAELLAGDSNDPSVNITVTPVTPAAGVTSPSNQTGVAVPFSLLWTGVPTATGTFTYDVTISDGTNSPTFTVTINVTNPPPTLTPATGSTFNASRIVTVLLGDPLVNAELLASDVNNATVDVTVTPVIAAPNVTAPTNQTGVNVPHSMIWSGFPGAVGTFTYDVTVSDTASSPTFTVTIVVTNPPPTLTPGTGSGFNASRVYAALENVALSNAVLVVNDLNDATVDITVSSTNPAPGITAPGSQASAAVPFNLTWSGTPTVSGSFTYDITLSDGLATVPFTVTITVTDVAPTLNPAAGSGFNASRVYAGATGVALASAALDAADANNTPVDITIVAVNAAPGVTSPANQTGAAVPTTLTWTGTPTSGGVFTYNVTVSDGFSNPTFLVTFNIQFAGTVTINQTSGNYNSLGTAFDAIEAIGLAGPVILEFTDSATYAADASYTIGMNNTGTVVAINGLSATNSITIRAATGQNPRIQGSATGAVLQTPLTGRGCLGIMSSFTTVEGIECFDGPNFGILIQGNSTTLRPINNAIRGCVVHDIPDGPGIAYMGQNSSFFENGVIENNFVWNCFTNSGNPTTTSVLLLNTGGSITVRNPHNGTGVVRHNTILHTSTFNTTGGIYTYSSSTAAAMHDVNNNIVVCTDATVPAFASATTDTNLPNPANCNHNYWFAATHCNRATVATFALWQASGRDGNGSNTNPMLVSTTAPFDLHLAATSPCIDPANQNSTATVDIDGDIRPLGPSADIGADEAIVPFIAITQGATAVNPGSTINVGAVATTTGATFTFTIANSGGSNLTLTGGTPVVTAIVNNLDPNSGVVTQPATTITPAGSVTFDIVLDPTIAAIFTMTVSIANDDLDRNPYTFTIDGNGFTPNGDALANTATGSSLSGGTNGPFTLALDPGTTLANVTIELTDPETDNITVNSINVVGTVPTGITAPVIPAAGHPVSLTWTGTADASNAPGPYTWEVSFQDAVNGNPVTVQVVITINNLPPQHAIASATGGNGSAGSPYTAVYTQTMDFNSDIDLASVTDPNTGQTLQISTVVPIAFPPSGNGFAFDIIGGFLNVAPANVLAAGDVGTHTFDVNVTDGVATITIRVSLLVNAVPNFVTVSPITDGEQGVAYSFTFVVAGGTGALTFSLASGTLPSGLGLNATNGMITGTPTLAGIYNFDVAITDTLNVSDTDSFTLTIDPPANGNPTITTTSPLVTGRQGDAYGPVTIVATGGTPGYVFTVTAGALPPGLTLSPAGVISGTATLQGTYAFTVTVTDSAFATDSDAFQITIDPPLVGSKPGSGDGGGCVATQSGAGLMAIFAILLALAICARLRPTRE